MLLKTVINKLVKAGWSISEPTTRASYGTLTAPRNCYQATKEGCVYVIEWHQNGGGSLDAICLKVRHVKDEDEMISDYHAGSYAKSVKQALEWAVKWSDNWHKDQIAMKQAQARVAASKNISILYPPGTK